MSLEMAQKVIVLQKKNYVPQFLKQRDINSYYQFSKFLLAFTKLLLNYINHYQDEFGQEIAYIKPTGLL